MLFHSLTWLEKYSNGFGLMIRKFETVSGKLLLRENRLKFNKARSTMAEFSGEAQRQTFLVSGKISECNELP
jgi:hypothetical protein